MTSVLQAVEANYFNNYMYINNYRKNVRATWTIINTFVRGKLTKYSNIVFNHTDKLNDYFANLGTNATKHLPFNNNFSKYLKKTFVNSMYLSPITKNEIIKIAAVKPVKHSSGFGNISLSF